MLTAYYECQEGDNLSPDAVLTASRHIDSLTFNRIADRGYENLTEFQKEIISQELIKMAGMYLCRMESLCSAPLMNC